MEKKKVDGRKDMEKEDELREIGTRQGKDRG